MPPNQPDLSRARALLKEQKRRQAFPDAVARAVEGLFPAQRRLVESRSRNLAAHAGRRGGKTAGFIIKILRTAAEHPRTVLPVFERTLTCQAAVTFWNELLAFDEKYGLGFEFHHTLKTATCPNGAAIQLMGADTIEAADKARGGKYPGAFVDEVQSFRPKVVRYLLSDVLGPALLDYGGWLGVAGTPPPVWSDDDPFYVACHNTDIWDVHHWTMLDNDHIPDGVVGRDMDIPAKRAFREAELVRTRAQWGWDEANSQYRREWLGEWVSSNDDAVYAYASARNLLSAAHTPRFDDSWTYVLGIDVGHNDPTAFVVLARRRGDPHTYVVESYEEVGLIPSAMAVHVERLRARYRFRVMVIDTGGLGKGYAEEAKQRFGLPLEAAKKRHKLAHIEYANGDLRNGVIRIVGRSNTSLVEDLTRLPWNELHTDYAPRYRDHLPDAFLYAHGAMRALMSNGLGARDAPEPGSPEWWAAEDRKITAALDAEDVRRKGRGREWYEHEPSNGWDGLE